MKKKLILQLILIVGLFTFTGVTFYVRCHGQSVMSTEEIRQEMQGCLGDLRNKAYDELAHRIFKMETAKMKLPEGEFRQQLEESCALLAMIHAAMTENDEGAIQIFTERCAVNANQKIELIYFDELLPYAKFYVLNVFLKRYDLQGAYVFINMYPKVEKGPYAAYFKAMDDFVSGDIPGSLAQLTKLSEQDPQNKMIINSMAYIRRVEKQQLLKPTEEK